MQRGIVLCVLALLSTPVDADNANPISKVIELLSSLEAKIMKDGENEAKAYKDFFEWCDNASRENGFLLKTETAKKEKLESTIAKAKSDIESAEELIASLSATIAEDEADLKAATTIREKEAKSFAGEEAELMSASDMLGRAITIIEREMKGSALIQANVENLNGLVQGLQAVLDATSISISDKKGLLAFVQNQQGDEDDMELGAPDPAVYKSKSGGIVDVLTDMKEKADTELSDLRKAEKTNAHNFNLLKLSIEDAIKANNHELDENQAAKAEAAETLAAAEGELALTNKALAEANSALDVVHTDCMEKAADHEITVKSRAEELAALAKAKKIIQQMTAGAVSQSYSFLQTSLTTRADLAKFEVVEMVKRLAKEQHSTALAQLASRLNAVIRYGANSGDDPFAKVKGLITDMITKLMNEAAAEASEKAYCDEEMAKTKAKKEELTDDIEKLTTKIDSDSSASERLKAEVKDLQKALVDLADQQAEMDKIREETHAAYVTAKADLEQGIQGVQGALEVLRTYYQSEEEAFVQQPAVPEKHEKSSGAGGSIINILEVAESDFTKNLAAEEEEEARAQEEYEKTTQENKISKATMEQDVKYKTKEFTGLDKAIAENSADRDGLNTELDAVLDYYEKIKERCIAKPETYEERKKRREAEIAGLKEALSILEGQAFLQRRSRFSKVRLH
jgi:chromosome segregation ATPase